MTERRLVTRVAAYGLVLREGRILHGIRILYRTELLGGTLRYEVDGSTDLCALWTLDDATKLPLVELVEVGLGIALPEG